MKWGCLLLFLQASRSVDRLELDWASAVVLQIVHGEALPEAKACESERHDSTADF